jgi:hypothetical protein
MKKDAEIFDSPGIGEVGFRKRLLFHDRPSNILVWLVDGEYVREHYDLEYVAGGHHYRYPFIPEPEVWLDETLNNREIPPTLLHELHERKRMKIDGWDYDTAHAEASRIEAEGRSVRQNLKQMLAEEIKEQTV